MAKKQGLVLELPIGVKPIRSRYGFEQIVHSAIGDSPDYLIKEGELKVRFPGVDQKVDIKRFDVFRKKLLSNKLIVSAPVYPFRFDFSQGTYGRREDGSRSHVCFETPLNTRYKLVSPTIGGISRCSDDLDLIRFVSAFYSSLGCTISDYLSNEKGVFSYVARTKNDLEQDVGGGE